MPNANYVEISKKALKEYDLIDYEIEYIGHSGNVIYRVNETDSAKKFSLRIHESRSQGFEEIWSTKESIHSEVTWLDALSEASDIVVPKPIYNQNNNLITEVNHCDKVMYCTLLTWVDGEQKPYVPTAEDAGKVGTMIGKLHFESSKWIVPYGFSRPTFDEHKLDKSLERIQIAIENGTLIKSGETLILAGQKAKNIIINLEKTNINWGVIHADLIPSNYIFHNDKVSPIDFGACGFGFYLFDLGWTFSYIHPSFRETLLKCYLNVFPLPSNYESLLETFFIAGQLDTLGFWLGMPDSNEWLEGHINSLVSREFSRYLSNKSFLYTGTPYWE
ncbi:phosphotransferase [Paenibacillus sp. GYB006]|uniref:phosphotransferase enzyme family protein n=1 Tax=Paenibacillus sp. GYB006 TaxID=2994394 RepID=UPI002F96CF6E